MTLLSARLLKCPLKVLLVGAGWWCDSAPFRGGADHTSGATTTDFVSLFLAGRTNAHERRRAVAGVCSTEQRALRADACH